MELTAARTLAESLMAKHGLSGWSFKFTRSGHAFGTCYTSRRTIGLSAPLTRSQTEEHVRDTILHEIAHALTPFHGHDIVWQQMATRLGASPSTTAHGAPAVYTKGYRATCPGCGRVAIRTTRPKRHTSCGKCNPVFDTRFQFCFVRFDESGAPEVPTSGNQTMSMVSPEKTKQRGERLLRYARIYAIEGGHCTVTGYYSYGGQATDLARYVQQGWVKIG